MSTTTSRLGLYKTASDGSEYVNVVTDLLNNWDAIDLAVGHRIVTSTTRPSTPYSGQGILESDTSYRSLVHNGTSPASGGWIEIPNGSAIYGSQIAASRATDSFTFKAANTFSGGNTNASVLTEHAAGTAISYASRVAADSFDRLRIRADGRIDIGPGTGARDTNLYRNGTAALRTDSAFSVGGATTLNSTLAVTGAATLSSTLAVTGNTTVGGNLTVSGVGQRQFAIKSGNTPNSTTTVASDPHLTAAISAAGTYEFVLKLFVASGDINADLLIQFLFPAGTLHYFGQGAGSTLGTGTTVGSGEWIARQNVSSSPSSAVAYGIASANTTGIRIEGNLIATASGNLTLQWAQFTSSVTAVTLLAGSSLTVTRVV